MELSEARNNPNATGIRESESEGKPDTDKSGPPPLDSRCAPRYMSCLRIVLVRHRAPSPPPPLFYCKVSETLIIMRRTLSLVLFHNGNRLIQIHLHG